MVTVVPQKQPSSSGKKATSTASQKAAAVSASETPSPSLAAFEPLDAATDYSDGDENDASATAAPDSMVLDPETTTNLKRELQKASKDLKGVKPTPASAGVMYLGHIPHGFYEDQMRGFFNQFGTVSRLRLARNKRTGRSKHYAFIEFKQKEVANIVAKSMNGYLMFSKILVAKVLPVDQVHPEMFKGANRPFKVVDRVAGVRKAHNKPRTPEQAAGREERLVKAERKKRAQLEKLGIEYAFDGYEAAAARQGKRTRGVSTSIEAAVPISDKGKSSSKGKTPAPAVQQEEARPAKKQKKNDPAAQVAPAEAAVGALPPKQKRKDKPDEQVEKPQAAAKKSPATKKRKA